MAKAMLCIAFVMMCAMVARAALNVGTHAPEEMVTKLRRSIFIETAYLEERPMERPRCSSLDGPRCLAALIGKLNDLPSPFSLDGPGVLPDRLLYDLGVSGAEGVEFVTPEYDVLEGLRRLHAGAASLIGLPLAGPVEEGLLREVRTHAGHGLLHFAGSVPDWRLPLSFSQGLPDGIVASWDGRWLVKDCLPSRIGSPDLFLALPSPEDQNSAVKAPGLVTGTAQPQPDGEIVSAVVELRDSLGYLRFSRPVIVRALFGRWRPAGDAPSAIVGGRLGLRSVWATHLDPKKFTEGRGWADLSGGPLQPVDEIVFVAMPGLEIAAVEVVSVPESAEVDGMEDRMALFLAPVPGDSDKPRFTLNVQKLAASAAPYVTSLQEAMERNLRLRSSRVPSLLPPDSSASSGLPLTTSSQNDTWALEAASNEALFQHVALNTISARGQEGKALLSALLAAPPVMMPQDLQRELARFREEVVEAVWAWSRGKAWRHKTPTSLPRQGSDEAVQRYATAKKWQTKLDLLTAALVYMRPHLQQR